mmetsp:Transcript_38121/g.113847  ORF Transcript_38121/g.113847 Transcript_38121/m.113847 type:complete len:459 (+) Transcript_38121:3-1379(+)
MAAASAEPGTPPNAHVWKSKTMSYLGEAKRRAEEVRRAVEALEQNETAKIEAQIREKKRQEALAAAERERKLQEEARRREEETKAKVRELMKLHRETLEREKRAEAEALKEATAEFLAFGEEERKAKELGRRTTSIRDMTLKLLSATLELQHECSKKFGIMTVCKKRMVMREKRPQEESFRDQVDEALAHEWQTLVTSRERLQALSRDCEQLRERMERTRHLFTTGASRGNVATRLQKSASLPSLTASRPRSSPTMALEEDPDRNPSSNHLMESSGPLLGQAAELVQTVGAAIAKSEDECSRATNSVTTALDRRRAETEELIKGLRGQRTEILGTITDAEKRIVGLQRRSIRVDKTEEDAAATKKQLRDAERLVAHLKEVKEQMEEDLRKKVAALKVDESCRTLTKVRAGADAMPEISALSGTRSLDASQSLGSPMSLRSPVIRLAEALRRAQGAPAL